MSTDIYKLLTYKNPIFANILLTYKCNFNCIHCYQKPIKSSTKIELNTNNWLKILDILKKNKILAIRFNCKLKKYCNICSPLIKYRYGKLCKPQKECAKAAQLKILLENE